MKNRPSPERVEQFVKAAREAAAQEAERVIGEAAKALENDAQGLEWAEKIAREGGLRVGRSILEAAVQTIGNGYKGSRLVCECGHRLCYVSDRERTVVTLVGSFKIRRAYYRCPSCGATKIPLDTRLEIERTDFSPGVRQVMGKLGALGPFEQGRQLMGELTGLWVSSRSHRLVGEQLGHALAARIQPPLAQTDKPETLYLLADGTMFPTRAGWREVKVGVAFVGSVNKDGKPQRHATRYFSDILDAEAFGWRWYSLAERMGMQRAGRVVVLGDGAVWIWNLAELHFPGAVQIVDWYHAKEHLWTVAKAVWGEDNPCAARWVDRAKKPLAGGQIEKLVALIECLPARSKAARTAVHEAIGYYRNNTERMRYRRFRRQGLFIGSGVVEAGCKHIVGQRLKGSGMRWSIKGARDILNLRLAVLYGPWPYHQKVAA
jgi:hypothetical protein